MSLTVATSDTSNTVLICHDNTIKIAIGYGSENVGPNYSTNYRCTFHIAGNCTVGNCAIIVSCNTTGHPAACDFNIPQRQIIHDSTLFQGSKHTLLLFRSVKSQIVNGMSATIECTYVIRYWSPVVFTISRWYKVDVSGECAVQLRVALRSLVPCQQAVCVVHTVGMCVRIVSVT